MNRHAQSGMSRIVALFWIIVFALGIYAAFQAIPFFYYQEEIEGLMQSQAEKAQVFTDFEIRKNIMARVKELDMPIDDDNLQINRFQGKITIETEYDDTLFLDFSFLPFLPEDWRELEVYTFHFHPFAEAEVK